MSEVVKSRREASLRLRVVEGSKRMREVREEQGNVSLLPARQTSLSTNCYVCDCSVSRQCFQNKQVSPVESEKEYECECPCMFFHFRKDEWAQRELLISVFLLWAISEILDTVLWIYLSCPLSPKVKFLSIGMWLRD